MIGVENNLADPSGFVAVTTVLINLTQSLAINNMQPQLYQEVMSLNVRIAQNTLTPGQPAGGWTVQNQPPGSVRRY